MPPSPATFWLSSLLAAALVASALTSVRAEVVRFARARPGDPFRSWSRVVRRTIAGLLVAALGGGVFYGLNYAHRLDQIAFVRFWSACAAAVPALLLLAYLDMRETRRIAELALRRELTRALGEELQARAARRRDDDDGPRAA